MRLPTALPRLPESTTARTAIAVGLLVLGAAMGLAAVALHPMAWGLLLAVAATSTTAYALPAGFSLRLPFALGWLGMVGYLTVPRGEGDYAIGGDLAGYLLLGFALLLLAACVGTLQPRRRVPPSEVPDGS